MMRVIIPEPTFSLEPKIRSHMVIIACLAQLWAVCQNTRFAVHSQTLHRFHVVAHHAYRPRAMHNNCRESTRMKTIAIHTALIAEVWRDWT